MADATTHLIQSLLANIRSSNIGTNSENSDLSTAMSKFIPTWRSTNAQTANDMGVAVRDSTQT